MIESQAGLAEVFRHADLQEAVTIEDYLSLDQLFSPENMWRGFELGFGQDRDAFDSVVDGLGLPRMVSSGELDITQVLVSSGVVISHVGILSEEVKSRGLVDGLEALQMDHISVTKDFDMYPRLQPNSRDGVVQSRIVLGKLLLDNEAASVPDELGVVLNLMCRYLPEQSNTNYDLAYRYSRIVDNNPRAFKSTIVQKIFEAVNDDEAHLLLPTSNYSLYVGPYDMGYERHSVRYSDKYDFRGDKVVPRADSYESEQF